MKHFVLAVCLLMVSSGLAEEPSPAGQYYRQALELRENGDVKAAMEEVGKAIALNPLDKDLLARSELLSAELYVELNMLDSAATTARQIQMLYAGTGYAAQAEELSRKIEQLKERTATDGTKMEMEDE